MIERFRALVSGLVAAACRIILILACGVMALGVAMLSLRFPMVGLIAWPIWRGGGSASVT